jgi:hypothetical protein
MALLEHFRYLARYAAIDDPEIVTEFGYLLAEAATDPMELAPALVQLLRGMPASVEIWSTANSVLDAIDHADAAAEFGWNLISHLSSCDLHQTRTMPLALSSRSALHLGALHECVSCSVRLLPDELLQRYALHFGYQVDPLGSHPVYIGGTRILARHYPWPELAPILADRL